MKIFALLKQVPDTETQLSLLSDGSGVDKSQVSKWIMNPYDEYALEEAIRLKEKVSGAQVFAVSIGPQAQRSTMLRNALALGADEAFVIDHNEELDTWSSAQLLAELLRQKGPADMIFAGKLAIDDQEGAVPQMVAELLELPHVTNISEMEWLGDGKVKVSKEIEGGARMVFEVQGPCVLSADKGLNTPRYAKLPDIMKAKKKPLHVLNAQDLVSQLEPRTRYTQFQLPPEKPPVKMLEGELSQQVQELVRLLREEAKVL